MRNLRDPEGTHNVERGAEIGYSTGTCAAAAAAAAARLALTGEPPRKWPILTPAGVRFELTIENAELSGGVASCGVRKRAGDDPDVTDGMEIRASVRLGGEGLRLLGGVGVGRVTRPGLAVPAGEPAINPVPRRMILGEVAGVLPSGQGAEVTILAPAGEERAKKTFNLRLGIVGGISILGTSGLVRPMSEDAWLRALLPQLDLIRALGWEVAALVPGNLGGRAAIGMGIPERALAQMSNFAGRMLEGAADRGFRRVLLLGHPGKLAKLAAGHFETHSRNASASVVLKDFARAHGRKPSTLEALERTETAEEGAKLLARVEPRLLALLATQVSRAAQERAGGRVRIGTAFTDLTGAPLCIDERGEQFLGELRSLDSRQPREGRENHEVLGRDEVLRV